MTTTETTSGAGLGALIRRRADDARYRADTDTAFDAELETWETARLEQETHLALDRIARTRLAHLLRIPPDRLGPADVTDATTHPGSSGDRAFAGRVRFDLGDTLAFEVQWTGTATIWLLTPCARTRTTPVPDSCERCERDVAGRPISTLTDLADALADPPTDLACRPCADAAPPF